MIGIWLQVIISLNMEEVVYYNIYGSLQKLLEKFYPNHNWEWNKLKIKSQQFLTS